MSAVAFHLRDTQASYLERKAEQDGVTESMVLREILDTYSDAVATPPSVRPRKASKNVVLGVHQIAILDALCVRWGLTRSDVVRRIIDDARCAITIYGRVG